MIATRVALAARPTTFRAPAELPWRVAVIRLTRSGAGCRMPGWLWPVVSLW